MEKIKWNEVTGLSQIIAIVLFVAVFGVGFYVGEKYENKSILGNAKVSAKFVCPDKSVINADFYSRAVHIETARLGGMYLTQTISGSGARYANADESIVFWNKGDTAFIQQNGKTTIDNCVIQTANK
jgi:membrane-bound inhibitor of C-type lysozyme